MIPSIILDVSCNNNQTIVHFKNSFKIESFFRNNSERIINNNWYGNSYDIRTDYFKNRNLKFALTNSDLELVCKNAANYPNLEFLRVKGSSKFVHQYSFRGFTNQSEINQWIKSTLHLINLLCQTVISPYYQVRKHAIKNNLTIIDEQYIDILDENVTSNGIIHWFDYYQNFVLEALST